MINHERLKKIDHVRKIKMLVLKSLPVHIQTPVGTVFKYAYDVVDIEGAENFGIRDFLAVGFAKFKRFKRTEREGRYEQDFYNVVEYFLGWRLHHNVHCNKDDFGFPPEWLGGEGQAWTYKCTLEDHSNIIGQKLAEMFLNIAKEKT